MRCSECDADNAAGQKFCGSCGKPLKLRCPSCGAENPPGFRFCGECGAALVSSTAAAGRKSAEPQIRIAEAAAENVEGERKTVTALFADIKGSTELEQDLDPEEARAIVDPALKLMIDAMHRYDGYIVQSTGDGIFALFGAPVAHEDHPQRALYAALRMQDELKRYSARLREAGNLPIEARVGVNTGEVVVRSITTGDGHTEYTPIGHTTNLASRMQALAPTGSIAISEPTRKLVEGYFALNPLGPTRVKGISELINVYEVTGLGPLRTRLQRSAGRGLSKFVGREREMEALAHAAELAKSGRGQIVAAVAIAGTGKSRLFFEFKAKNQSGWMVLETVSFSHSKASAYLPVIELLHTYFRITSDDDARTRREKVNGRIVTLDPALEDTRSFLFALLGIAEGDDPLAQVDSQVKKRRTFDAIKRILLRESLNQPLMVIFEDLHWIDEQTQEFLNLFADSIANARILLLMNYRPEYRHEWGHKTYYTQLRLDPLGKESAEVMISALLGSDHALEQLKRMIIEKTDGNPFFMEETYQVLLDEGALVRDGSAVRLTKRISELKIPPTVQAILAARIDRLPSDEKDLLQTLAVIGKEFPLSLVRAIVRRSNDDLDRMLNDLQLAEFVYEQPTVGDTEYSFKHALTQEVSYNSVLMERRRMLHGQIGAALETLCAVLLDDHLSELAHHYGRSANSAKAIEYFQRAGIRAVEHSAYTEAAGYFTAGLELLQNVPDSSRRAARELEFQFPLAQSLRWTKGGGAPESGRALTRARELCMLLGERPELFSVLHGVGLYHVLRMDFKTARNVSEQLLALAERSNDPKKLMVAHGAMGQLLLQSGEFLKAREHLEQASPRLNWERSSFLSVFYPCFGGWTLWVLGYPEQALQWSRQALTAVETLSPQLFANALCLTARLHMYMREPRIAQERGEAAIAMASEYQMSFELAYATIVRGWARASQGRPEEGLAEMRRAFQDCATTGYVNRPRELVSLAYVCAAEGNLEEGLGVLAQGIALTAEKGERMFEPELHRFKGELLLKRDAANLAEAEQCFRTAIDIARAQSGKALELRATTSLARLLCDTNRHDEARAMLADIYNWFTEGFDTADLKDAKALLDELSA